VPAGIDDDSRVGFDDERRAFDRVAGIERFAQIDRRGVTVAVDEERRRRAWCEWGSALALELRQGRWGGLAGGVDGDRFDDQRAALVPEAKARAVDVGEAGFDFAQRAEGDRERRVGALVAQV
jgi:hypothetical protein